MRREPMPRWIDRAGDPARRRLPPDGADAGAGRADGDRGRLRAGARVLERHGDAEAALRATKRRPRRAPARVVRGSAENAKRFHNPELAKAADRGAIRRSRVASEPRQRPLRLAVYLRRDQRAGVSFARSGVACRVSLQLRQHVLAEQFDCAHGIGREADGEHEPTWRRRLSRQAPAPGTRPACRRSPGGATDSRTGRAPGRA